MAMSPCDNWKSNTCSKIKQYPVGTDQLLNVESTLIQRWASTFLNHPNVDIGWEIVDFVTMINQKSTSQPQFNQRSTKFEVEILILKMVEIWLTVGWF